jgi:hypothetical protein
MRVEKLLLIPIQKKIKFLTSNIELQSLSNNDFNENLEDMYDRKQ